MNTASRQAKAWEGYVWWFHLKSETVAQMYGDVFNFAEAQMSIYPVTSRMLRTQNEGQEMKSPEKDQNETPTGPGIENQL